uniref:Hexose transporter 1 n=1 Tax=Leptocylindrus danicus TaxID=163516 RepID=A0A7S2K9X8_9STRA|mmetsp:Transcript_2035/g.2982  ORF Transcript_2035/g.2982 Transcript_2035/m.2982 type:complete len:538 (+) Transcript_2035:652-2265(+)|eukprot:CAMPEP_0116019754 /NCGR_PEP_ID=MMETSP0321-20121206/9415_1 /TAXON_ID=163516 /ORGANISM="Leptocylindrus danicus var. danicus, Strain B650" /LENGTH=537 /DNA_ID=CAMNT_0003490365 /DNA_START=772 /DNA_END=2385 /DNA_ORIENTATION=+
MNTGPPPSNGTPNANNCGDTIKKSEEVTPMVRKLTFCAALNSCNLGFDIGVYTGACTLIQDSVGLTDRELEIFIGSVNIFAMMGSLATIWLSDTFGRRNTFRVSAIIFLTGVIISALAENFECLMIGRFFIGLGVGSGMSIDPIYIAEISPPSHRGSLVTYSEFSLQLGIMLGFASLLVYSFLDDDLQWHFMVATGGIMPFAMLYLSTFVMCESPRWLVVHGRVEEAEEVLAQLYPAGTNIQQLVDEIQLGIKQEQQTKINVGLCDLFAASPAMRRILIVGLGAVASQQISGIDPITYYVVRILKDTGIDDKRLQALCLILLGTLKLPFLYLGGKLLDSRGRRPVVCLSLLGCIFATLMIAINFFVDGPNSITLVGLAIFLCAFSFGIGPGAFLIASEVFFTSIRGKAMGLATCINRLLAATLSMSALSTESLVGWGNFFLIVAGMCVATLLFYYMYVPETKGKRLEEMVEYFAKITGDDSIFDMVSQDTHKVTIKDQIRPRENDPLLRENSFIDYNGLTLGTGPSNLYIDAECCTS